MYTIHSLFNQLAHEVGGNMDSLSLNRRLLSDRQRDQVERLRGLHSLWISPDGYAKTFLTPPPAGGKCHFQQNRCEACILARVGGDLEVLLDLRTILLSRTRTKKSSFHRDEPILLVFVEAWLSGLKAANEYSLLSKSWTDAQALKAVRKQIWKGRAKERKKRNEAPEPEQELTPQPSKVTLVQGVPNLEATEAVKEDQGGAVDSDMENDIVVHHTASISRGSLPSAVAGSTIENGCCGISGTMACVSSEGFSRTAEEWAKSYQNLLSPLPMADEGPWDWEPVAEEDIVVT
jgi:hypothetical protein